MDAECAGRNLYKELKESKAYAELTAAIIKLQDAQDALEAMLTVQPKQASQTKQPTVEDM